MEVELEADADGIGLGQQHIVQDAPLYQSKFEVVIVIGKADSGAFRLFPQPVELGRYPLEVVNRGPVLLWEPRYDHVSVPDLARGIQRPAPVPPDDLDRDVTRWGRQSVAVKDAPHLLRLPLEIARELHLLVADRGQPRQGPLEVALHFAAPGTCDGSQALRFPFYNLL